MYRSLQIRGLTWFLRGPLWLWSQVNPIATGPSDGLGHNLAKAIQTPGPQRDRMTEGIFISTRRLEHALELTHRTAPLVSKLRAATKSGRIRQGPTEDVLRQAIDLGVLSAEDADQLVSAEKARKEAIRVDSFSPEEYMATSVGSGREWSAAR